MTTTITPATVENIAVGDAVVHRSGLTGTVLAVHPGEGIDKTGIVHVSFPDGFALRPGGPKVLVREGGPIATEWHVPMSSLAIPA